MDKKNDVFSDEYTLEPSTGGTEEPAEKKPQEQTATEGIGYYDKSKPYRIIIKAKEIKG